MTECMRAIAIWVLLASSLQASTVDNIAGIYALTALPDAASEAARMDRMQLCDQQPAGRYVRQGEQLVVDVGPLPAGYSLNLAIGFRPMWGSKLDQQEEPLESGSNEITAEQDGPVFFAYTVPAGRRLGARGTLTVRISGGKPLPLYVDGTSSAEDWEEQLSAFSGAPFVQLVGDQAMITLPTRVHRRQPISDPAATFSTINEMLDLQNALAGFDGSSPRDQPTPLRTHFLVDFRVSAKDAESFYLYATEQFIGMLPGNTGDLTDPDALRERWGIWHETGHTQQQNSWTWDALTEINVNLFSLYVEEAFGQPNRLAQSDDGEPTSFELARDYLEAGANDLLAEVDDNDEGDGYFVRLVMFHQLQSAFGWELFTRLHQYFRAHPLPDDASDQDKADALVSAMCALTAEDLRPFFERWGLQLSDAANEAIDAADYDLPERDYTQIFE